VLVLDHEVGPQFRQATADRQELRGIVQTRDDGKPALAQRPERLERADVAHGEILGRSRRSPEVGGRYGTGVAAKAKRLEFGAAVDRVGRVGA
jgi:hypothetical protein